MIGRREFGAYAVRQGDRMGLIRFGSRVDIFLPTTTTLRVKVGDVAFAGVTVIAASRRDSTGAARSAMSVSICLEEDARITRLILAKTNAERAEPAERVWVYSAPSAFPAFLWFYCTRTTSAARRLSRRVSSRALSNFGRSSPKLRVSSRPAATPREVR